MDMDYRPNTAINRSLPLTERNLRLLDEEQRVLPVAVISQVGHINGHDGPSGEADRAVVNDRADPGPLKTTAIDHNVVMKNWLLDRNDALSLWLGGAVASSDVNQEKKG